MFLLPSKYVAALLISFCAYLFTQFFISYNTCYGSSVCVPYLYDVALLKHTPTNMYFVNNLSGWYCGEIFLKIFFSIYLKNNFMKPHKISTQSDNHGNKKLSEWAEWVEILWGFTKFFFQQLLKISAFYLEKQKSFIPKKKKI